MSQTARLSGVGTPTQAPSSTTAPLMQGPRRVIALIEGP